MSERGSQGQPSAVHLRVRYLGIILSGNEGSPPPHWEHPHHPHPHHHHQVKVSSQGKRDFAGFRKVQSCIALCSSSLFSPQFVLSLYFWLLDLLGECNRWNTGIKGTWLKGPQMTDNWLQTQVAVGGILFQWLYIIPEKNRYQNAISFIYIFFDSPIQLYADPKTPNNFS